MRSPRRAAAVLLAGTLLGALSACQAEIGDECSVSTDCSPNGDRFCDVAQPGGYCTVIGCDPDTCPDDALCVEWRFEPTRSAETWCMKSCGDSGDCDRNGYVCIREGGFELDEDRNLSNGYDAIARVIDLEVGRDEAGLALAGFCAAAPLTEEPLVDAGAPPGIPDAGAPDGATPDAGAP